MRARCRGIVAHCAGARTNINELDPQRYDIAWWRQYWKRTQTQGVVVNAGGIVAYYPSKFPLHYRASGLGDRDLFGELTKAAHEDGLAVFARTWIPTASTRIFSGRIPIGWRVMPMVNRTATPNFYVTMRQQLPYYDEYIPSVLPRNH